jgi:hypothetical protein
MPPWQRCQTKFLESTSKLTISECRPCNSEARQRSHQWRVNPESRSARGLHGALDDKPWISRCLLVPWEPRRMRGRMMKSRILSRERRIICTWQAGANARSFREELRSSIRLHFKSQIKNEICNSTREMLSKRRTWFCSPSRKLPSRFTMSYIVFDEGSGHSSPNGLDEIDALYMSIDHRHKVINN